MFYQVMAGVVVLVHLAFILFAVLGGLLVLRWRWWMWVHLPAVGWAIMIEFAGWICPLTPLENWLRERGDELIYHAGFIEQYILPLVYPALLTRRLQIVLALVVLGINLMIYGWVIYRSVKTRSQIN